MNDIEYLVRLADWCAGQGFCGIEGIEDPDEWCYRRYNDSGLPTEDYSAEMLASYIEEQNA